MHESNLGASRHRRDAGSTLPTHRLIRTGVETAKNCLLQGVGHLALYDPKPCAEADRGANFFIGAPDVGRPRDQVCAPRLQELNPDAVVHVAEALNEDLVESCTCVVFTDGVNRAELIRWNEFCRSRMTDVVDERGVSMKVAAPISFVWAVCAGLCLSIFVDHGDQFECRDADGERPVVRLVESISCEKQGPSKITRSRTACRRPRHPSILYMPFLMCRVLRLGLRAVRA